jgi:AcrR family transcriptional regulator
LAIGKACSGVDVAEQHRTPKSEKLTRLEASALKLFASCGYDGASLRDIARDAQVPLSLIDRHFGSKLDLFHEVYSRIWRSLNQERDRLLAVATREAGGAPGLDAVIWAFAKPVVSLVLEAPQGRAAARLIRENTALMVHRSLCHGAERTAVGNLWVDAFRSACPGLTRVQAVWGLSFVVDTVYSGQLLDDWLETLLPAPAPDADADAITDMVVAFCSAGLAALSRHEPAPYRAVMPPSWVNTCPVT